MATDFPLSYVSIYVTQNFLVIHDQNESFPFLVLERPELRVRSIPRRRYWLFLIGINIVV
jgi:hypothetical protein